MKKFTLFLLTLVLALSLVSCGLSAPAEDGEHTGTVTIQLNIIYPKEAKAPDITDVSMNVSEKASVLQVLEAYCEQEGIEIAEQEHGKHFDVISINSVQNKDNAAWAYEVNDKEVDGKPSEKIVKNGDKVTWKYNTL